MSEAFQRNMSATVSRFASASTARLPPLTRGLQGGVILAVTLGAGHVLLRHRLLPKRCMRLWFLVSATLLLIPASALLYLLDLLRYLGVPRQWVQDVCVAVIVYAFKGVCWWNPQIRMRIRFDANEDGKPRSWADIPPSGIAIALNHTSFWDVFEMISLTPLAHLFKLRTLMKSSLRQIPVFGGVFDRVGHFPVYFKSDEDGNFQVDKERQAVVQTQVDAHLANGGSIAVFPEGAVNRHPETLQPFRFGTFVTIFQHRLPTYYMVAVGNEKTWAPQMSYGGLPADILVRIGAYPIDFDTENSKTIAVAMQRRMQQVRDEMVAEMEAEQQVKKK